VLGEEEVDALVRWTSKETVLKGLPPEPLLPVRSIGSGSQGPIEDADCNVTIGSEGWEGPETVTFIVELYFHWPQGAIADNSAWHFALKTDALNKTESPTSTRTVDDACNDAWEEEDAEEG
jgi:hypothetical protein